jgi:hypothetical protein
MIKNVKITLGDDTVHEFNEADTFALHPMGYLIVHSRGKAYFYNTDTVAYYSYDITETGSSTKEYDDTNVVRLN